MPALKRLRDTRSVTAQDLDEKSAHRKRIVAFVVGLALVAIVLVLAVTMIRNNQRFDEWKAQLHDHPLPPGAAVVDSGSRFGLLWGNGSHCDGEAWMILQGELTEAGLERHYSDTLILRFEGSFILIEMGETADTWRVSARGRIGTAGLDLRCN